jgi:hypothetical protein
VLTQTPIERLFIVEVTNWKEAVVALLEPESHTRHGARRRTTPKRAMPSPSCSTTDPESVLTELGYVGNDATQLWPELSCHRSHRSG